MENASKALIIAGAILLAIVLVSLGVLVINNSRKNINDQNIDDASIEAFNKNITQYCGKNKSGTQINSLMSVIAASNGAQIDKAEKHFIGYNAETIDDAYVTGYKKKLTINGTENVQYAAFSNNIKYDVKYTTDDTGYITAIIITKNQ